MNYQDTIDWLYNQFPFYQRDGKVAYKKDINNVREFFNKHGADYLTFKSIHVGGTNGKGSVSHMLSSILQDAGYKVGLFTSPHIIDFKERIKINNQKISSNFIVKFINDYKQSFQNMDMSFFEMTVAMAFRYFAVEKVDFAIIEVGLGGRLDATNIIHPELSIITNVSLDHVNILGHSINMIAKEKSGIIKFKTPVLVGETKTYTQVFMNKAFELQAQIHHAKSFKYKTDLNGYYQNQNINTSVTAIHILRELNYQINDSHIESGLLNVVSNTNFTGRWQIIHNKPLFICDIGHNIDAMKHTLNQISEFKKKKHIILGFSNDKQTDLILDILPKNYNYYICGSANPRILPVSELSLAFDSQNLPYKVFNSSVDAYRYVMRFLSNNDVVLATGSTFIVADILKYLEKV